MLSALFSKACGGWALDQCSSLGTGTGDPSHSGMCWSTALALQSPWQERDLHVFLGNQQQKGFCRTYSHLCPLSEMHLACMLQPKGIHCALAVPDSSIPHSPQPLSLSLECKTGLLLPKMHFEETPQTWEVWLQWIKRVSELTRTSGKVFPYYSVQEPYSY